MKGKRLCNTVLMNEQRKKLNLVAECNRLYCTKDENATCRVECEASTDEVVLLYPALFITVILCTHFSHEVINTNYNPKHDLIHFLALNWQHL